MILTGNRGIINYLEIKAPKSIRRPKRGFYKKETLIYRKSFSNITFTERYTDIEFKDCTFRNCTFEGISGFFCIFSDCEFVKCNFFNSIFTHLDEYWTDLKFDKCYFNNVKLEEGAFFNIEFLNCEIKSLSLLGLIPFYIVSFKNCHLESSQFQSVSYYQDDTEIDFEVPDLIIDSSVLDLCSFNNVDLINSYFISVDLFKTTFSNTRINKNTFSEFEKNDRPCNASIDFQSILKSDDIDKKALEKYFNIYTQDLKKTIQQISQKADFKSIFISYSLKDKDFANTLNNNLIRKGIKTFLWENDAQGGARLNDIMAKNIEKYDKILFIASCSSIKSKTCHFELSQGRKKQEETWEEVFIPIHIDNYLFEVKKENIRPIDKADEYWLNIEELLKINSIDFNKFNKSDSFTFDMETEINKIIVTLRK